MAFGVLSDSENSRDGIKSALIVANDGLSLLP
jgi:hypothetical protein